MDQKQIGAFIAQLRQEKGWTQQVLGEQVGVTNKTVSRWEKGNYMPDLATIPVLCQALEISVNEFFSGQRLEAEQIQQEDAAKLLEIYEQVILLKRLNSFSTFFESGGIGTLYAALCQPNPTRKVIMIGTASVMLVIGWYLRSRYDNEVALILTGERDWNLIDRRFLL